MLSFIEDTKNFTLHPLLFIDYAGLRCLPVKALTCSMFLLSLGIHKHGKAMNFPFVRTWTSLSQESWLKGRDRLLAHCKRALLHNTGDYRRFGHQLGSVSQNHRIVGVGRDLCGSSSATLLPKQGYLQ